jgi:hypothetical protein
MPNAYRTRELDLIESKHMHCDPGSTLLVLDVSAALDELLEALQAMTPAERAEGLLS